MCIFLNNIETQPLKKISRSIFILTIVLFISFQSHAQNRKIDSLLKELIHMNPNQNELIKIYVKLSYEYNYANIDSSIYFAQLALEECNRQYAKNNYAECYNSLGTCFYLKEDYNKAETLFLKGIEYATQYPNEKEKSYLYINLSNVYSLKGDFIKSLEYNFRSAQYFDSIKDYKNLSSTILNRGTFYLDARNYTIANKYYQEALVLLKKYGSPENMSLAYYNLGSLNCSLKKYEIGIRYIDSALTICSKNHFNMLVTELNATLAYFYALNNQFNESIYYTKIAENLREKYQGSIIDFYILSSKAYSCNLEKNYSKAVQYCQMALKACDKIDEISLRLNTLNFLSDIYSENKQFDKAYYYAKLSDKIDDSLTLSDQSNIMLSLQFEHQNKLNEIEKIQFEKDKLEQNKKITFQTTVTVVLSLVIIILVLILYYALKLQRKNKTIYNLLSSKNKELEAQRVILSNMNKNKEKMLSLLSHDLRSPMLSLNALFDLFENGLLNQEDITNAIASLKKRTKNTIEMLDNILKWSVEYAQTNYSAPILIPSWYSIINESIEPLKDIIADKKIKIEIDPIYDIKFIAEPEIFKLIVRNLVNNSVKFSNPNSKIEIHCRVEKEKVITEIKDFGIGLSAEQIRNILSRKLNSTIGTNAEKGSGIGLRLCMDFIELSGGLLEITSTPENGTTFMFDMPYIN